MEATFYDIGRRGKESQVAARTYLCWLVLALMCGAVFADSTVPQIKWAPDLASARRASAQFKVPLLVHFYGDGCLPCRTLEKNVFANPEVVQVLNKFFICVLINGTRDRNAMSEFEIHSYPTDVFLSPIGEKLHQGTSPQDVKEYLAVLERVAVMNRDTNAVAAAQKTQSAGSIAQQTSLPNGGMPNSANPLVPSLPPPGFAAPTNTNTPGYYTASGASIMQQQLQSGLSSSNAVQTGPLSATEQPPSISGAVQSMQTQIGGYAEKQLSQSSPLGANPFPPLGGSQNTTAPELPKLDKVGQLAINNYSQLPTSNQAQLPTVSAQVGPYSATLQPGAQTGGKDSKWSSQSGPVSSTMDNPHFGSLQGVVAPPALVNDGSPSLTPNAQPVSPVAPTNVRTVSSTTTVGESMINGYCPVSLRFKQWRKGNEQFAVKHRGMVFLLADQECFDAFMKNPDFFTPVLLGNDPMILLSEGRLVPGSSEFGALFEDRVGPLLFSSAESKAEFHKDFAKNMTAIEAILRRAFVAP